MTLIPEPLDLSVFIQQHKRLPQLGDSQPPWMFRGWLLPYIIQLHGQIAAVGDRWGYHLRTLEAGRLLDEPIPQIMFGPADKRVFTLLHDWSQLIGWDCGGWSDFRTLLDWLCWALALTKGGPRLNEEVNEKLYRQVNLVPLLETPHDYLADHVTAGKSKGWNPTAFYPTPHPVVECMVRMTMHDTHREDDRDHRTLSTCDPCVGSGRMLLHASNISMRLYGQDIDPLALSMCKINGALYAPWLSYPLPDSILSQNSRPSVSRPVAEALPENVPASRVDQQGQTLLFEESSSQREDNRQ